MNKSLKELDYDVTVKGRHIEMTLSGFQSILMNEWGKLDDVRDYLNDAGLAKREVLQGVYYLASFCNNLKELYQYEDYSNLINVPDKHPEYYRTLRMINRFLERVVAI